MSTNVVDLRGDVPKGNWNPSEEIKKWLIKEVII